MRKFLIIVSLLASSVLLYAQTAELDNLIEIVKSLRSGSEKSYNNAVSRLASDRLWTPMDELQTFPEAECKASERVPGFKLNSALTNAENSQRYQTTTGNHLNGADSRFNYSLFEKTIRPGKTVNYTLQQRWGEQVFILIPYSTKAKLSASVKSGKAVFKNETLGSGIIRLTGNVTKGSNVTLDIRNDSKENISYVIINYNSRK